MLEWLKRLLAKSRTKPVVTSSRVYYSPRTQAGVYIDPDQALRNATVWACVQYLTKTVAQLPWHVMKETTSGGSEVQLTHPVDWLLNQRPCPDMGSFAWRQAMLGNALLWGNGYAEIERDLRGAAYALWPIHPDRVVVRRSETGALEYEVWNYFGGRVVLPAENMFHLRGFGDGPIGYNVITYAAESLGWARATEIFGSASFSQGINPTGVIEAVNPLSPSALDTLKDEVKKMYQGPRGDRTLFLDAGMKFNKIQTTLEDSQFVETRQHQIDEICRWFGVPPHKVQHLLRATFSNIEHQSIEVVVDSITPWCKAFEEEANYKLFGIANRQGLFTKLNLKGLMRGDSASRAAYYKNLWGIGVLTINEIRALEDMNGIGAVGDKQFIQNVYVPIEEAGLAGKPQAAPAPTEEPPPNEPEPGEPEPEPKASNIIKLQ